MRCMKCGYTSFDYLERCKNCSEDLVPSKIKLNIYTQSPEIDIDENGFVVSKVAKDRKDLLGDGNDRDPKDITMDDVLGEEGENLENFDFSE